MGGSVFNRPITAILSRSDHCAAAFFLQGVKNYTDVKLVLFYRLILETYMIFTRKQKFLSYSVYCPDTSKRVPQIVTATETEWRKRVVRDWIETKRAKNYDTLRDLKFLNLSRPSQHPRSFSLPPPRLCTSQRERLRVWWRPNFTLFTTSRKMRAMIFRVRRNSSEQANKPNRD